MKSINVRELRLRTPAALKVVKYGEKVVITHRGKPQALLLGLSEDEIEDLVYQQPAFVKEIEEARNEY